MNNRSDYQRTRSVRNKPDATAAEPDGARGNGNFDEI